MDVRLGIVVSESITIERPLILSVTKQHRMSVDDLMTRQLHLNLLLGIVKDIDCEIAVAPFAERPKRAVIGAHVHTVLCDLDQANEWQCSISITFLISISARVDPLLSSSSRVYSMKESPYWGVNCGHEAHPITSYSYLNCVIKKSSGFD